MLCPVCSPRYRNNHLTLAFNTSKDVWQCFRCLKAKGRDVKSFLFHVGLPHYLKRFDTAKEDAIDATSLAQLRQRLLATPTEETAKSEPYVTLPDGYRTDFEKTLMGKRILTYLLKRNFTHELIEELSIGYAVEGECSGAAIFPVVMNSKLVFWQARRVMFATNEKYHSPKLSKNIVYGYDWLKNDVTFIVEGIIDSISLRPSSIGLLGKTISNAQIALLAEKNVKRVIALLDGEAWEECKRLARDIRAKLWTVERVQAWRLEDKLDPGDFMGRANELKDKVKEEVIY